MYNKLMLEYLHHQIEVTKHKFWVWYYCMKFCNKLMKRALMHDSSKHGRYEAQRFAQHTKKLKGTTYGSDDYTALLTALRPALTHHYTNNRHHPEYHANGFEDMSEIDRIEMIFDWLAATRRHSDGDIFKSLKINQKRFKYSDADRKRLLSLVNEVYDGKKC